MAPSTEEEIATQHAEAIRLVDEGLPCAKRLEFGEIPLSDKQQPTCQRRRSCENGRKSSSAHSHLDEKKEQVREEKENALQIPHCFSTRGTVDVSQLQKLVEEGYNADYRDRNKLPDAADPQSAATAPFNYWDPRSAASFNVSITRPSHDTWGIGKIVLLFSDDFATNIYQLPWWKKFEPALQPILRVLDKGEEGSMTLVRVLLASLPPGVTIPVHHDSGEWVKIGHRVHVPILVQDPSRILFRCGPTPQTMQRIDCTPGHVFEINNQAKHAVSNCDTKSRVHLILDYLPGQLSEGKRRRRIVLDPGERLVQTRRSIDRLKDMRKRPTPSYIILGAQKAGTTSLYDYINQHPWVVKARRRETHCFDWRWNTQLITPEDQLAYCRKFFYTEDLASRPSCLTGDSTPSYLLDSRRVIPRIQSVYADWKLQFFVMMRDPVKRAHSHFAMATSPIGNPAQLQARGMEWRNKTLEELIEEELKHLHDCGLIPYWDMATGTVHQNIFDTFSGSPEESMAFNRYLEKHTLLHSGSYGLLVRGMYALQLRPWLEAFDRDQFLHIRLESMKADGVSTTMQRVWAHLDLPNMPVHDVSVKNSREYDPMTTDVRLRLERFFEPHNRQLMDLIGSEAPPDCWSNPWPYESSVTNHT